MQSLKDSAIQAISKLPDTVDIDEIMYQLYVLDKVQKGKEAIEQGNFVLAEELKEEIDSW